MEEFNIGDYVSLTFAETRMVVSNFTPDGDVVCLWHTKEPYLREFRLTALRGLVHDPKYVTARSGVFKKHLLKRIGA
jgi:uncharacterized protein YodC (DUF2158 family)